MALRFIDGVDHYSDNEIAAKYNQVSGATVIDNGGRFQGGAVRLNDVSTGKLLKTLDAKGNWIVGFAFMASGLPVTNTVIAKVLDNGAVQVDLRLNSDGTLSLTRNGAPLSGGTTVLAILVGTWHFIEFKAAIKDSILAGEAQIKIDNALAADVAAGQDTQDTANSTANAISLHGSVPTSLFDDIYICDGSGGVCTDFLGDHKVVTILPNAAGDLTDFTVFNAGNNWSAQANNPSLGDGQYVASSTPGHTDLYNLQDPTLVGPIAAVQTSFYGRKDDAGAREAATEIKTGGLQFTGASTPLTASYLFHSTIYELNPDTAGAWVPADITALQAGLKLLV